MKLLQTLCAAALFSLPVAAFAAPIYQSGGELLIDASDPNDILGDFFDDFIDGLDISVTGSLVGPTLSASLLVSDASGSLLSSSSVLSSVLNIIAPDNGTATQDSATIVFDTLLGSETGLFGSTATVVFTFFAEDDDGTGYIDTASVEVFSDLTPIPLPASLPLLGGALLGAFAMSRRRRS